MKSSPPKREGVPRSTPPNPLPQLEAQSNFDFDVAQVCQHPASVTQRVRASSRIPFKCANASSEGGQPGKTRSSAECSTQKGHYRPIATSFKAGGFNYRQIAREDDIAIYEQRWIQHNGALSDNVAYEVVRLRRHEAKTFPGGTSSPAREAYPPSEAWGVDGFTLTDKDRAYAKLRALRQDCERLEDAQ